jgi:hypothetical protein
MQEALALLAYIRLSWKRLPEANTSFFALANNFSQVQHMWVRPGAYSRGEYLKGGSLRVAPDLLANIRLGWKSLPEANTSLFCLGLQFQFKCKIWHFKGGSLREAPALLANIRLSWKRLPEANNSFFALANNFSLFQHVRVRPGAYPRGEST